MKSLKESTGAEVPTITALEKPSPTQILEDTISTLTAEKTALTLEVAGLKANHELGVVVLNNEKQRSAGLAELLDETRQKMDTEHAKHVADMREQHLNLELVRAELERVAAELAQIRTERDEAVAQWEEWSGHPFFGAILELARQSKGTPVNEELREAFDDLVNAVSDTGKGGAVVLTLGMKVMEGTQAFVIASKVATKLPKGDPDNAIVFVSNGRITNEDPSLPPRMIDAPSRKPKPTVVEVRAEQKMATAKPIVEPPKCPELTESEEQLYLAAVDMALIEPVTARKLQQRLKLGYNQTAKLMAALEARGAEMAKK